MTIYFSEEHEWVSVEGDIATIGITTHAAEALGEVVFIEQQDAGETFDKGDEIGVIESVKAASDIYAPLAGKIIAVNDALVDTPEMVNEDPYGNAWFFKMELANADDLNNLLDADAYAAACE